MGKEPILWGWVAGAGTAMGREPILWERKASRNRAIGAFLLLQKGNGQQQGNWGISAFAERERTTARQLGHFCFCRKGTDSKAALGQSAVAKRGGRQTGQHFRAECRSSKGAEGKQGSILGQSAVAAKGRKANRAAF